MISNTYPVFEKDGEEYVADVRTVLTSNPPQYNAYKLKDRKMIYISCHAIHTVKYTMTESDFHDFMTGKWDAPTPEVKEEYFSDTERLDWIIQQMISYKNGKPSGWLLPDGQYFDDTHLKTAREAIDAAMEDK